MWYNPPEGATFVPESPEHAALSQPSRTLLESLTELVETSPHGTRLPTVRALMQTHGVGQGTVQRAIGKLKEAGQVTAAVGRGTYVIKEGHGAIPQPLDSLLILSNSSMNERCARVQAALVERVRALGGKAVQISYHDTDHLLQVLSDVPRFDAIVLQSHYEPIPIRLLSVLKSKARAVAVDGHTVSGVDVDRMGIDWEDAMALALDHLTGRGHARIALVSLDSASQPILAARRFFGRFDNWKGRPLDTRVELLRGLVHPTDTATAALGEALDRLGAGAGDAGGAGAPTGLILMGVSDGAGSLEALRAAGLAPGGAVDVVMLGHTDVVSEHRGVLPVAGGRSSDGAEALMRMLAARLEQPGAPPMVEYIPTALHLPQG
jgi:DNA-binding LacI/PurR family transcriptional regulator